MSLIILVVALILLVVYLYKKSSSIQLYFFNRDSCPACVAMKEEWEKFVGMVASSPISLKFISSPNVTIRDIKTDSGDPLVDSLMKDFGVKSVPTVIAVLPDGRRALYDGDRTANSLLGFITQLSA